MYVKCPVVGVSDAHGHASLMYVPTYQCLIVPVIVD